MAIVERWPLRFHYMWYRAYGNTDKLLYKFVLFRVLKRQHNTSIASGWALDSQLPVTVKARVYAVRYFIALFLIYYFLTNS